MTLPFIKVFGERNTGTNFVSRLLSRNLPVQLLRGTAPAWTEKVPLALGLREASKDLYFRWTEAENLGWKHRRLENAAYYHDWSRRCGRLLVIALVKNPYSWLLSLYRRPYHQQQQLPSTAALGTFLARPWPCVRREHLGPSVSSPVALWNEKSRSCLQLAGEADMLVWKYEDLLNNPAHLIERVAETLELSWERTNFTNVDDSTKGDTRDFGQYRDYYLQEQWRAKLNAEEIGIINDRLDTQVVTGLGYALVSAEPAAEVVR